MDYYDLLKKYMRLVYQEEGITYIYHIESGFTEEEQSTLVKIDEEIKV